MFVIMKIPISPAIPARLNNCKPHTSTSSVQRLNPPQGEDFTYISSPSVIELVEMGKVRIEFLVLQTLIPEGNFKEFHFMIICKLFKNIHYYHSKNKTNTKISIRL